MNLHNIRFRLTNIAIWVHAYGGNGRDIGNHLWVIPEGEPTTEPDTRPGRYGINWWVPRRLQWHPFNFNRLFADGYIPPLCGQRSQSRMPRAANGWARGCEACIDAATLAGIVPLTYEQAREQSSVYAALQQETREWTEAGRPSPWPPLPSDTPTS